LSSEPLVSVIIPTYNRAHTVAETIDSVLAQSYRNLEVIVVDDGSKDATQDVLKSYGSRIRSIWQENAGQMVARNQGIAESQGNIVTFLDSDDIWLPNCVMRHVDILRRTGSDVPCSLANGWLEFDDGRRITSFQNSDLDSALDEGVWRNVADILATRFVMFCQFVAIRREALEHVGGFDEDLKFMEDYALPLRLSMLGPWAFIREPLVVWRQGAADSVSVSQRALKRERDLRESLLIIRRRYLDATAGDQRLTLARKLQTRALLHDQLEIRAIDLRSNGSKVLGDILSNVVRCRKAIDRRMPNFVRMATSRLES
jgi:glycosyltransferase involved in cell wall biosynthesis